MGTVSEVRIARRTGFCYGVREAIDAARISAAEGKSTHTLGQVVHNENGLVFGPHHELSPLADDVHAAFGGAL